MGFSMALLAAINNKDPQSIFQSNFEIRIQKYN